MSGPHPDHGHHHDQDHHHDGPAAGRLLVRLRRLLRPHSHEAADKVDAALVHADTEAREGTAHHAVLGPHRPETAEPPAPR